MSYWYHNALKKHKANKMACLGSSSTICDKYLRSQH